MFTRVGQTSMARREVLYKPSVPPALYHHEAGNLLFVAKRFLIRYYWGIYKAFIYFCRGLEGCRCMKKECEEH